VPVIALKFALIALLAFIAFDDLRSYRIRNVNVCMALVLTLALLWLTKTSADYLFHLALACVCAAVLLLAYAGGAMGGGDVKLLAVAFLCVGPAGSLLFALALLGLALLYWLAATLSLAPSRRIGGRLRIPFGPGIAGAWIVVILASARP